MIRSLAFVLSAALVIWSGACAKHDSPTADGGGSTMTAAATDVCPHCPGVQKATADGKCEKCLMPVSTPATGADACPVCPGVQKATADGKCPICGAAVMDACPKCPGMQTATADGKCPICGAAAVKTSSPTTMPTRGL